jgi:hypothetical protein
MGLRYISEIKSTFSNTEYGVQIYDTSFSGTPMEITLGGEGVELTYLQQGDEKFAAIKGSEAKIYLKVIRGSAGTELETWINSVLLANNEDKYQVSLSKGSELIWFGNILHDLSGQADDSRPYDFVLTATDGLARLKDFTFDYALNDRYDTFTTIIHEILQETPLYRFGLFTYLYSTSVEWWEDSMPSRSSTLDPLALSRVHNFTFAPIGENDEEREPMSYWDVLTKICEAWGMRLIMSQGRYKFIQINNYEDVATTRYERLYLTNGTFDSAITLASEIDINVLGVDLPRVMNGNQWNYFAPIKQASIKFPFSNKNMLDQRTTLPYSQNIAGTIVGGSGKKLVFNSIIRFLAFSGTTTGDYRIQFQITLKLGTSHWLRKSSWGTNYTWNASSNVALIDVFESEYDSFIDIPISFTTPDIPTGAFTNCEFEIEIINVREIATGINLVSGSDYRASRLSGTTQLIYNASNDGQNEAFFEYIIQNTSSTINSLDLELEDAIIGENYQPNYFGGLQIYNGSAWVQSTSKWKILDTGTGYDFVYRRLLEIIAAQMLPIPKYQGAIIGHQLYPDSLISYSSKNYILNGGTFKFESETWDGEWFVISTDRASAFEIENATNQDGGNTNQDLRRTLGGLNEKFSETTNRALYFPYEIETISANTTGIGATKVFLCDNPITFTLAPAADWITNYNSSLVMIKNICSGSGDSITVNPHGSELIEGNGSLTINKFHTYTLISDGTAIWILNYYKHS